MEIYVKELQQIIEKAIEVKKQNIGDGLSVVKSPKMAVSSPVKQI